MSRRHSPGCNCCSDCCDTYDTPASSTLNIPENGTPGDWIVVSDCCKRREWTFPADQWEYACSAPTHTDNRYEGLTREIYLRAVPYIRANAGDNPGSVSCGINKATGLEECYYDGTLIQCGTESLCTTMEEYRELDRKRYLVARWRPLKFTLHLVREELTCTGDTSPVCKWILVAKLQLLIQYDHYLSTEETYYRNFTGSGCCDCDDPADVNTTHPFCEDLTAFANSTTVTFTRSKEYDTEPTGTITFAADEQIDCGSTPGVDACAGSATGDDSVTINSNDDGSFNFPYTAPSLSTSTYAVTCKTVIEFDDGCSIFTSLGSVTSCSLSSGLLPFLGCGIDQDTTNATCWRTCADYDTGVLSYFPKFDFDSSHVDCSGHTFGRTSSGYTARSITIDAGTWSVSLT